MIDSVQIRERPKLRRPVVIAAFTGWPDAGEVASGAISILIERLSAVRFGEIDPEFFLDYSEERPIIRQNRLSRRSLRWPSAALHSWRSPDGEADLILVSGPEPHLRWRTYCNTLLDLAQSFEARLFITLGGTFDAVPHTGPAKLTAWSNSVRLTERLRDLGVGSVDYTGPTCIHSALLEACEERSLPTITLWGHAPQYVRTAPNPKLCHATLSSLRSLLDLPIRLDSLRAAARELDRRVSEAVNEDADLSRLVRELEAQHEVLAEDTGRTGEPLPDSQAIVRELEEFLRGAPEPDEGSEKEDGEKP